MRALCIVEQNRDWGCLSIEGSSRGFVASRVLAIEGFELGSWLKRGKGLALLHRVSYFTTDSGLSFSGAAIHYQAKGI